MGPLAHVGVAVLTAGALQAARLPEEAVAAAFLTGTLIDADHLIDYAASEGLRFDFELMRSGAYFKKAGRALVLLHSYELVLAGAAAAALLGRPFWGVGILAGAGSHLLSDVLYYRFDPRCYSIVYRSLRGFSLDAFKRKPRALKGNYRYL